ncbi:MAG: sugar transferase [Lachnospiraceae bacterium]|nr:sugar transferase [Lachnospiraceae bacterium]MDD7665765.1 sugar transferase [Lachnospiraceae bacterium]MDY4165770.1 sugar transferase [Lachnospiraceae bacterium]
MKTDIAKRSEEKDLIRKLEGMAEVLILTVLYFYIWKTQYSVMYVRTFYGRGRIVMMGIYFIIMYVIMYLTEGLRFGNLKLFDVVVSQWISVLVTNFITFWQICLILNIMTDPVPMLWLTLLDLGITVALPFIFTWIYHLTYVPRDMVLVYGKRNALNLRFKILERPDKYAVTSTISSSEPFEKIKAQLLSHDAVIINDVPAEIRNDILKFCYEKDIRTYIVPKISDVIIGGASNINLFDTPLLLVRGTGLSIGQKAVKRFLDIVLSALAIGVLSPVFLVTAIAIKAEDGGSVFFRQKRVTRDGRIFTILKFRSMHEDAEKYGAQLTVDNDPRITKVGRFIRRCRIDELPQLINIIRGDMSIVGPRPERIENYELYEKKIPEFKYRTKVKAGLTGYAQVYGKYNTTAYDKLRLDLMYIENYSIILDIKLVLMTFRTLFQKESTQGFEESFLDSSGVDKK